MDGALVEEQERQLRTVTLACCAWPAISTAHVRFAAVWHPAYRQPVRPSGAAASSGVHQDLSNEFQPDHRPAHPPPWTSALVVAVLAMIRGSPNT